MPRQLKRQLLLLGFILGLLSQTANAQISFLGFDQDQCGLTGDYGYTYENIDVMCGSHGNGYKIYSNGELVFQKCTNFATYIVHDLLFINQTTGFLIEAHPEGTAVYKTENSGQDWTLIGGGAPSYLGFYLINEHTGYLITTWDLPLNIYINRTSDIRERSFADPDINQDVLINDTIFGDSYCGNDFLSFQINNAGDTIEYKISFITTPLSIESDPEKEKIEFYPNPSSDFIAIRGRIERKNLKYKITDLTGKVVSKDRLYNNRIYVGDLSTGSYLIELESEGKTFFGKIIKY